MDTEQVKNLKLTVSQYQQLHMDDLNTINALTKELKIAQEIDEARLERINRLEKGLK